MKGQGPRFGQRTYNKIPEEDTEKPVVCGYIFEDSPVGRQIDQDCEGVLGNFLRTGNCSAGDRSLRNMGLLLDGLGSRT